jgi:hypothetical protein
MFAHRKVYMNSTHALGKKVCRVTVLAFIVIMSVSAFAALGGDASSVDSDQAQMRAQRRVTQTAKYSVHELQAYTGATVREFLNPQGKVFGVAWAGQAKPDMRQVLGTYYDEYAKLLPTRRLHRPVTIQGSNFVVESGGHQRALAGRAYIPGMVPQGVDLQEIH